MDKRILPFEDFKKHCNLIHNNKYDYSKVKYVGMKHPITIICPHHGEFVQRAHSHYLGHDCFGCSGSKKITNEDIISQFVKKHGNRYDYSKVQYKSNKFPVEIVCVNHGSFYQSPYDHKNGYNCPKCSHNRKLNKDLFIEMSNIVHDFIYEYDGVVYNGNKIKVIVKCKTHGDFLISPNHHLRGQGCPNCKRSKGEIKVMKYLMERNIKFIQQYYFNNLKGVKNGYLFYDFFYQV